MIKEVVLQKLRLYNFRNHHDLHVELSPAINFFIGNNGTGKTNILEAIYFMNFCRSPRVSSLSDFIYWGAQESKLEGTVLRRDKSYNISYILEKINSRVKTNIFVDNEKSNLNKTIGILPLVYFEPSDILLIRGEPGLRRRTLNSMQLQITDENNWIDIIRKNTQALKERNVLLKQIKNGRSIPKELAIYTEILIETSSKIRFWRNNFIKEMNTLMLPILKELTNKEEETVFMQYLLGKINLCPNEEESILAYTREEFERKKRDELFRGTTLSGASRDDIQFIFKDHPAINSASQGQQKSIIMTFKLAEAKYLQNKLALKPLVILDDILSELDVHRQNYLMELIQNELLGQTFIASADVSNVQSYLQSSQNKNFLLPF